MIYAIAAYSITLGALLVYGVLLQHRARIASLASNAADEARVARSFNLGAALLAPVWTLARGMRAAGLGLIAATLGLAASAASGQRLPALVLASLLAGAALFFGAAGNRIALARARAAGVDALAASRAELRWAIAGALIYTVALPWAGWFAVGSR